MSVRVMTKAWEVSLPASEKLVLLALADQANDDGHCWPSAMTIARKCGQGERTVRRAIQSLITKGHLSQRQRSGTSAVYSVHPCQSGTTAKSAPLPETPDTPATLAPKPLGTIKPKKDKPSLERARKTRLPANFEPILTPAVQALVSAWPAGMLERELAQFKDRNTANGQTYDDWQAALRTWIRNADKWRQNGGRSGAYPVGRNQPDDGLSPTTRAGIAVFGAVERSPDSVEAGFHG